MGRINFEISSHSEKQNFDSRHSPTLVLLECECAFAGSKRVTVDLDRRLWVDSKSILICTDGARESDNLRLESCVSPVPGIVRMFRFIVCAGHYDHQLILVAGICIVSTVCTMTAGTQ
jgi:hypothetical protein